MGVSSYVELGREADEESVKSWRFSERSWETLLAFVLLIESAHIGLGVEEPISGVESEAIRFSLAPTTF